MEKAQHNNFIHNIQLTNAFATLLDEPKRSLAFGQPVQIVSGHDAVHYNRARQQTNVKVHYLTKL